jgi:hypothetical protein
MNAVVTTCVNYASYDLRAFFVSVKRHVPNCTCIVFTHNLTKDTVQWLRDQGAELVPMQIGGWRRGLFNRFARFTDKNPLRYLPEKLALRLAFHTAPIMSLRFLYYREWLNRHVADYDKVFITDLKDVVFQDDPFSYLQQQEVQFFLESQEIGCANDVNSIWMDRIYSRQQSRGMLGKINSCAGTTLGSSRSILKYLEEMNHEFINAIRTPKSGEDQAMHNMILRRDHASFQRRAVPNGEGAVLTVLNTPESEYVLGEDDLVRNKAGVVIPVLHTYDRYPDLVVAQKRRLGLE